MIKLNGQIFGYKYFGNGEINFEDGIVLDENQVEMYFTSNDDILVMQIAVEYIRDVKPDAKIELVFWYLPYSAMDRKINVQLFSLKYLANIINKMGVNKVKVFDAHNMSVLNTLVNNVEYIDIKYYTDFVIKAFKPDVIYFPDKGAYNKYPSLIDTHGLPIGYGHKVRDLENKGKIISYNAIIDVDIKDKRVLIIDDICRRGGTFELAAKALKELGANEVGLYVSHCEIGIIDGGLLKDESFIDKIYTTSSENAFIDAIFRAKGSINDRKITVL